MVVVALVVVCFVLLPLAEVVGFDVAAEVVAVSIQKNK